MLMPQLSTVRLWFATFQVSSSLFFFLAACLLGLRWAREGLLRWKALSLLAVAMCLGFYEIFAPMLIGMAGMTSWIRYRRDGARWLRATLPQLADIAVVGAAILLKGHFSERAPPPDLRFVRTIVARFIDPHHDWRVDSGLNARSLVSVHFWDMIALPFRSIATMIAHGSILFPLVTAAIIAGLAWWRLEKGDPDEIASVPLRPIALAGLILFVLGYATFLLTGSVTLSPAGIANRTGIAAALGVALLLLALIVACVRRLPPTRQPGAFMIAIIIIAALFTLRIADIGQHWIEAANVQRGLLEAAKRDLAHVPTDSIVILDGVCPYVGSGIVFESAWDTHGAYQVTLNRRIWGDIITDRAVWAQTGIATRIYGQPTLSPYGPALYIYNPSRGWLVPLPDYEAAIAYRARPDRFPAPCPRGYVSHGVPM